MERDVNHNNEIKLADPFQVKTVYQIVLSQPGKSFAFAMCKITFLLVDILMLKSSTLNCCLDLYYF